MAIERRHIEREDKRCVSSNQFDKDCEKKAVEYIEQGFWVCFCADCIGHTRALMFENSGEIFLRKKYGDVLQVAEDDWGTTYYRLK